MSLVENIRIVIFFFVHHTETIFCVLATFLFCFLFVLLTNQ